MMEVINITKDVANGSKHMVLDDKSLRRKVVTNIHPPEIRDWYSYFIAGPQFGISTKSSYYSVSDLVFLITSYFEWIFDDSMSADIFPENIEKHLEYCKIE